MRPHERPSQTPSVLRLDVARRKDLSLHDVGLRPRIALVTRRAELKPRPALDRRVGVGALPGKRREAQERATGPVLRDDARSLDGKLVGRDRLGEDQDVALVTGLHCHGARIGAPMLDGLRREFPEVVTLARAIPHPRVARASPFWSVMAAFGAGFFASGIVTILVSLLFRLTTRETPLPSPFELAGLAGTAAALAVAWVGGGRSTVAGYFGVLVLERLLGLPGQLRFCGQSGGSASLGGQLCSVGGYVIALWPQLLGVAVAIALVRWLRTGPGHRNPTLEAAGVFTLVESLGGAILNVILGPATVGSPVWPLSLLALTVAAGVAVGYTVVRRAASTWRALGTVALVIAAEFALLSLPLFVSQVAQARGTNLIGPFEVLAYFSPVFAIGAAVIVLYVATTRTVNATGTA